jgi:hypothetical protein
MIWVPWKRFVEETLVEREGSVRPHDGEAKGVEVSRMHSISCEESGARRMMDAGKTAQSVEEVVDSETREEVTSLQFLIGTRWELNAFEEDEDGLYVRAMGSGGCSGRVVDADVGEGTKGLWCADEPEPSGSDGRVG